MDIKEELFREDYLFTREDILKSLELMAGTALAGRVWVHVSNVTGERMN